MTSTWQHQYLNCSSKNRKQTYIPIHINTMVLIHKNKWFECSRAERDVSLQKNKV